MQRRSKALRPAIQPITPEFPEPRPEGKLSYDELATELFNVRTILRSERLRHAKTAAALTRYNELLEKIVKSQREAFEQLHAELVPNIFTKGSR